MSRRHEDSEPRPPADQRFADLGRHPSENGTDGEEDTVSRLLRLAGRRPVMPAPARQRSREIARGVWRAKVARHAAGRRRRTLLIAAGWLLAVAGAGLWWRTTTSVAGPLGQVAALSGEVSARIDGRAAALAVGNAVDGGLEISTADGRVSVDLAGASVRLDRHSRLRLESRRRVVLAAGGVYVDSGGEVQTHAGFEVVTPLGSATDIGTQFEVRLEGETLAVRVREGEVRLDAGGGSHIAEAGSTLAVRSGGVERGEVDRFGPSWEWVLTAAPAFELEGRTVRAFLDWVCRETGWRLRFDEPDLEAATATALVHGSVEGLRPDQAPALVLPTAGLDHRVEAGVLHVARAAP